MPSLFNVLLHVHSLRTHLQLMRRVVSNMALAAPKPAAKPKPKTATKTYPLTYKPASSDSLIENISAVSEDLANQITQYGIPQNKRSNPQPNVTNITNNFPLSTNQTRPSCTGSNTDPYYCRIGPPTNQTGAPGPSGGSTGGDSVSGQKYL